MITITSISSGFKSIKNSNNLLQLISDYTPQIFDNTELSILWDVGTLIITNRDNGISMHIGNIHECGVNHRKLGKGTHKFIIVDNILMMWDEYLAEMAMLHHQV